MKPEPLNLNFKKIYREFRKVYNVMKEDMGWEVPFEEYVKDIRSLKEDIEEVESCSLSEEYAVKLSMFYCLIRVKSAVEWLKEEVKPSKYYKKQREGKILSDLTYYGYVMEIINEAFKDVLEDGKN